MLEDAEADDDIGTEAFAGEFFGREKSRLATLQPIERAAKRKRIWIVADVAYGRVVVEYVGPISPTAATMVEDKELGRFGDLLP